MGLDLITRAEYKTYAGISSTNNDAVLAVLIPKVSDLIKTICRRSFVDYVSDAKVEYFEGGTANYMPEETPVISVSSVEISEDYGNTYTALIEYTDYAVNKRDGSIRCINKDFPVLINGYKVTYTAGYETIPQDLKLAALDLVSYYLKNDSAVHSSSMAKPNTMQVEYITTTNLPAHIKRVLDLYTASYA
jgi:hypothetical protein